MVTRPDGVEHARLMPAPAGAGGYVLDVPIPDTAPRGVWRIDFRVEESGPALASTDVLVEDFRPERIAFDLALPDAPLPAGQPVEADIAGMAPGELRRVEWRGKPVWLIRRTPKMLESLNETQSQVLDPDSDGYYQIPTPEYAKNQTRSIKPEVLVVIGICTHLGCIPLAHQGDFDGYFCPCHGSQYDTSGRIRRGPAPLNLAVPPYEFLSDTKIRIG